MLAPEASSSAWATWPSTPRSAPRSSRIAATSSSAPTPVWSSSTATSAQGGPDSWWIWSGNWNILDALNNVTPKPKVERDVSQQENKSPQFPYKHVQRALTPSWPCATGLGSRPSSSRPTWPRPLRYVVYGRPVRVDDSSLITLTTKTDDSSVRSSSEYECLPVKTHDSNHYCMTLIHPFTTPRRPPQSSTPHSPTPLPTSTSSSLWQDSELRNRWLLKGYFLQICLFKKRHHIHFVT